MDGFDIDSPLVCEGIVGDGCGGGRIFIVEDESLVVFDPTTSEREVLLADVIDAKEVTKDGCIVTIKTDLEVIEFDLSLLRKI